MLASKNHRFLLPLIVFLPIVSWGIVGNADFKVVKLTSKLSRETLVLDGSLDLGLTAKVEEALNKGIPLDVVIELRLRRQRALLWDENVAEWQLRRQIRFHALTGQYFVNSARAGSEGRENFNSLSDALRQLGSLDNIKLSVPADLPQHSSYAIELRASLDFEALPTPLRPVAYTSRAWHLDSGWFRWNVSY